MIIVYQHIELWLSILTTLQPTKEMADITFEPWASKRTTVLANYTTSEKIPITTVS